jgi:hypothetical protein
MLSEEESMGGGGGGRGVGAGSCGRRWRDGAGGGQAREMGKVSGETQAAPILGDL